MQISAANLLVASQTGASRAGTTQAGAAQTGTAKSGGASKSSDGFAPLEFKQVATQTPQAKAASAALQTAAGRLGSMLDITV